MDDLRLLKKLGEGSYAVVFEAQDRAGTRFAVKQLKDAPASWAECVRQPEIAALRKVQHRNVLRLHRLVVVGDSASAGKSSVLLVSELLEADLFESLEAMHLRAQRPRPEHIRWLGRELLSGLSAIHEAGVLHRDLKPENVMLAGPGSPSGCAAKLVDFGQAKDVRSAKARRADWTAYVATRWYRAPELLLGAARYTGAVDVWACGVLLAEALTGRPVFPGDSPSNQLFKIAATLGAPQTSWPDAPRIAAAAGVPLPSSAGSGAGVARLLPAGTPADLVAAVAAMVQWDPAARPTARQCLALPFFASGSAEPILPGRPPSRTDDQAGDALRRRAAEDEQTRLEGLAAAAAAATAAAAASTASREGGGGGKRGPAGGAAGSLSGGAGAGPGSGSDTDEDFADGPSSAGAALAGPGVATGAGAAAPSPRNGLPSPGAAPAMAARGASAPGDDSTRGSRRKGLGLAAAAVQTGPKPASEARRASAVPLGSTLGSILGGPRKPSARKARTSGADSQAPRRPADSGSGGENAGDGGGGGGGGGDDDDDDFDYVPSFG
ncbi:hypothetical protein FNF31_05734 [Cafeteria roenbergensis]|uniref:Protein kinase domain-containing protein n=1 Tax=Cafeteria roenbergensis TaxID=33653 RepID=A0A5A8CXA3_CAFRO|nr:hypothetical protein FNF31_05734 [Cafeteria roenbergensis]